MREETTKIKELLPSAAPYMLAAEENIEAANKHLVPIFKLDDLNVPRLSGTGVLLQYEMSFYLVTATHVLKRPPDYKNDVDGEVYCFIGGQLSLLQPERWRIIQALVDGKDFSDVSVMSLSSIEASRFDRALPYQYEDFDIPEQDIYVCAMGFPATRNSAKGKNISRDISSYFWYGKLLTAKEILAAGFLPQVNVGAPINFKKSIKDGAIGVKPIQPNGISGGPLWVSNLMRIQVKQPPILAGIITDYRARQKILVGAGLKEIVRRLPPPD